MRVAVVGHVEWVQFARVERVPGPGEIVHALDAGVVLDALVMSESDTGERVGDDEIEPPPRLVVSTAGSHGGHYTGAEGVTRSFRAAPLPGPVVDAYGCGDSFAAGLTFGLAADRGVEDALELAARCGAACLTGRGP